MAIKDRLYDVPVLGTALRVQDRYVDDAGDQLAAAIGFFGFLSLFPLLLLAFSVLGFLFRGDPGLQGVVIDGVVTAVPGFGQMLDGEGGVATLLDAVERNAGTLGIVGLVTVLFTGLKVVNAAMVATTRVFRLELPTGIAAKGRQLGALVGLGLLALLAAAASGVAGVDVPLVPSWVMTGIGFVVSMALDVALFLVAYRVLAAAPGPHWRELWPGALLTGTAWTLLKVFSSTVVASQIARADELYGAFAGLIALMLLLYLAGRLYVYGAELSAVTRDPEGHGGADAVGPEDEPASYAAVGAAADPGVGAAERTEAADRSEARLEPAPRLGSDERSPTISPATAERVEVADRALAGRPTPVRHALATLIALGTVAGLAAATRPWADD